MASKSSKSSKLPAPKTTSSSLEQQLEDLLQDKLSFLQKLSELVDDELPQLQELLAILEDPEDEEQAHAEISADCIELARLYKTLYKPKSPQKFIEALEAWDDFVSIREQAVVVAGHLNAQLSFEHVPEIELKKFKEFLQDYNAFSFMPGWEQASEIATSYEAETLKYAEWIEYSENNYNDALLNAWRDYCKILREAYAMFRLCKILDDSKENTNFSNSITKLLQDYQKISVEVIKEKSDVKFYNEFAKSWRDWLLMANEIATKLQDNDEARIQYMRAVTKQILELLPEVNASPELNKAVVIRLQAQVQNVFELAGFIKNAGLDQFH